MVSLSFKATMALVAAALALGVGVLASPISERRSENCCPPDYCQQEGFECQMHFDSPWCVPTVPTPCGPSTCEPGSLCCNPCMGFCTPPGAGCANICDTDFPPDG
jgi:hypothetical protein